jgi:peptidyl-prolyl cis-trans isomerase C
LAFAAVLWGCSGRRDEQPAASPVATVGGVAVPQALFDAYLRKSTDVPEAKVKPEVKASLIKELQQLKAAAAIGEKLKGPWLDAELELNRLEYLAHRAAVAAGVDKPPTDEDLQVAYRAYVATLPDSEYHIAHILVATESTATQLISMLQGGASFAKLALERSADETKVRGGDLGWIKPGKLPPALTEAARALKSGTYTLEPVHTAYGWHVVKLLETRTATAPEFERVRAQLGVNWKQERYHQFLEKSLDSAEKRR